MDLRDWWELSESGFTGFKVYRNCSHGVLEGPYVHSSLVISKGFSASGMFFPHDSIAPGQ